MSGKVRAVRRPRRAAL